jgi:hypothetical protein
MVAIAEGSKLVRLACESCGAHATFAQREHETLVKQGRRVECDVCGTWQAPTARPPREPASAR